MVSGHGGWLWKRVGPGVRRRDRAAQFDDVAEHRRVARPADVLRSWQLMARGGQTRYVRRINRTNSTSELEPGLTVTDAIARRDELARRRTFVTAVAAAAAGEAKVPRQLRVTAHCARGTTGC